MDDAIFMPGSDGAAIDFGVKSVLSAISTGFSVLHRKCIGKS